MAKPRERTSGAGGQAAHPADPAPKAPPLRESVDPVALLAAAAVLVAIAIAAWLSLFRRG